MASQPGGQYVFSVPSQTVNLALSADGNFPPPTGDFDIAVFVTANGTPPADYEGSAFAQGGGLLPNNRLGANALVLNNGDYQVNDFGGSDQITAGSGNQSIVGGIFTTILGGTGTLNVIAGDRNVVQAGDAAAITVNALVDEQSIGRGELINLGTNGATVFASGDDSVNAGSGPGQVGYFHGPGDSIETSLTIQGAAGGPSYTVSGGADDSLFGGAQNFQAVLAPGDIVSLCAGNATINAAFKDGAEAPGQQIIRTGGANATVYANNGDQVFSGDGKDVVLFFHGPGSASETDIGLQGAASGTTFTVIGAGGDSLVGGAANITVIGAAGDSTEIGNANATVNALRGPQLVDLGDGPATVFAGSFTSQGDTVLATDTVIAGSGTGLIALSENNSSYLTVSGAGGGSYTVAAADRNLSGTAANVNIQSFTSETILGGTTPNITVNAADGLIPVAFQQLVNLGDGAGVVYADAGDTINAGSGSGLLVLESGQNLTVTGASGTGSNITVASGAGQVIVSANNASVAGAAGDTIIAGAGNQVINGTKVGSANEVIQVSGGNDSVFAGAADSVGVGPNAGGGTTVTGSGLWLDSSVNGGAVSVGYGTFLTDTTGAASQAQVTVGTVSGGAASETFDVGEDFLFGTADLATTQAAIASSVAVVDVSGVSSLQFTLPDGTGMTLVGLTATDLPGLLGSYKQTT